MTTLTVLLTGGTGLLGTNLIPSLLGQGYKVICLYRSKSSIESLTQYKQLSFLRYPDLFSPAFQFNLQIDIVVHCAGLVSYKKQDKEALYEVNKSLTKKLGEWALKNQVKQFIYISSIAALGKSPLTPIVNEITPANENTFTSNYGRSKKAGELALMELGHKGLNWVILQPSVILAPSPCYKSSARLIEYVMDEKPFYTSGLINYVDVRDVCSTVNKCISLRSFHETVIISGGYTSYKNFFCDLAQAVDKRPPFIPIPNWALLLGAFFENLWSKILGKHSLLSRETAKMAGQHYVYSNEKSKHLLKHKYYSLDASLQFIADTHNKKTA